MGEEGSKQASRLASKQASKRVGKQSSEQASKRVGERANKRAGERANKRAGKRASKSEEASKRAQMPRSGIRKCPCNVRDTLTNVYYRPMLLQTIFH